MEGLAEGNDTASYFLPVHAESACRRYRSRPSSLALPHCRLKREREREKSVGLGWVNGVYRGPCRCCVSFVCPLDAPDFTVCTQG